MSAQFQRSPNGPIFETGPSTGIYTVKTFEKSTRRDIATLIVLVVAPFASIGLPESQRVFVVAPIGAIAFALGMYWVIQNVRKNYQLPSSEPRKLNASARRFTMFPPLVSAFMTSQGSVAEQLLLMAFWMSVLITGYVADAIVNHLARPADSIERRAELSAAAISFLAIMTLLFPLLYAASFLTQEELRGISLYGIFVPLLGLAIYGAARSVMIRKAS